MRKFGAIATAGLIAAAGLALSTSGASAAVVCNDDGDCWHTKTEYTYPPSVRLQVRPHDWSWAEGERDKYRWREREGRGYWRGGAWEEF